MVHGYNSNHLPMLNKVSDKAALISYPPSASSQRVVAQTRGPWAGVHTKRRGQFGND